MDSELFELKVISHFYYMNLKYELREFYCDKKSFLISAERISVIPLIRDYHSALALGEILRSAKSPAKYL